MVSLMSVFYRFPGLDPEQRNTICERRMRRAFKTISYDIAASTDCHFAMGYSGNIFLARNPHR